MIGYPFLSWYLPSDKTIQRIILQGPTASQVYHGDALKDFDLYVYNEDGSIVFSEYNICC